MEKTRVEMSEAAKAARRAYNRAYAEKNREKLQKQRAAYWERKAKELAADASR